MNPQNSNRQHDETVLFRYLGFSLAVFVILLPTFGWISLAIWAATAALLFNFVNGGSDSDANKPAAKPKPRHRCRR